MAQIPWLAIDVKKETYAEETMRTVAPVMSVVAHSVEVAALVVTIMACIKTRGLMETIPFKDFSR